MSERPWEKPDSAGSGGDPDPGPDFRPQTGDPYTGDQHTGDPYTGDPHTGDEAGSGAGTDGGPTTRTLEPYTPAAYDPSGSSAAGQHPVRARRFWSSRRVPAALTAAVGLGLAGLFLYDVASVRADRDAMAWRTRLADELATRHLDNVWVIVGAAVAAVLGLWLIVLALTPGERQVLPMTRRGPAGVRAGLDRRAAELVLRDRAMEVPGIRWVRVTVGRRRIKARGTSHFRELDAVRGDLTAALGDAVQQLGLARPPQLTVHVQRAEKKG